MNDMITLKGTGKEKNLSKLENHILTRYSKAKDKKDCTITIIF